MKKWVRAFTYEPKIPAVLDGRCTQTIRMKHTIKAGDTILFHGWEGVPYYSRWSWRFRVRVKEVIYITVFEDGIRFASEPDTLLRWDQPYVTRLAKLDSIQPPTGEALGELMNKMHNLKDGFDMQIIRWDWPPLKEEIQTKLYI